MVRPPVGTAGGRELLLGAGRPGMAMITDATLASETEAEGLAFARSFAHRSRGN